MSWLSKIDPDTLIFALTVVWGFGGWLVDKARGRATDTFRETIFGVVDSIAMEMFGALGEGDADRVNIQGYLASVRARVSRHVWTVLAKRNVPRNKITERLVQAAIERASAMLARELAERRAAAAKRSQPSQPPASPK